MTKAQSAIEFMLTYSWVFIIIALFIVTVVLISDSRPPAVYLGSSCTIQPLLPCTEALVTYNAVTPLQYYIVFTNQLGSVMYFPPNAINISTSSIGGTPNYQYGNCQPSYASDGSQVVCTANIITPSKPKAGSQAGLTFTISYSLCSTGTKSSCTPGLYKSSGFSAETMAPSNINLDSVSFVTVPPIATIVLNGVTYYNGISTYLPSGNYILFSTPPPGYQNIGWSIVSPSSTLSSTTASSTMLKLNSNATVTATYVAITTSTSLSTTSTSLSTTSTSLSTTSTSLSTTSTSVSTTSTSLSITTTSTSTTSSTSSSSTSTTIAPTLSASIGASPSSITAGSSTTLTAS